MIKIIVLTPLKNEAWILNFFLSVTSKFADHIIIADQNSTDESLKICSCYQKVILFNNPSNEYDEDIRQQLLINKARELFGLGNILFTLDADEIVSLNSLQNNEWNIIKNLPKGTSIFVEKPDLYKDISHCIRYSNKFPIAFVDDGTLHVALPIHSRRIPNSENGNIYNAENIKVMHFGLANMNRQKAKARFYSVVEAVKGTKTILQRREAYNPLTEENKRDIYKIDKTPSEWFEGISKNELCKILTKSQNLWYNKEILTMFEKYGFKKFWADNIWDVDWKKEAQYYGFKNLRIQSPPTYFNLFIGLALKGKKLLRSIRNFSAIRKIPV